VGYGGMSPFPAPALLARRQEPAAERHGGRIFFSFCFLSLKRPNINCKHNQKGIS
jgi:hypothetical protein